GGTVEFLNALRFLTVGMWTIAKTNRYPCPGGVRETGPRFRALGENGAFKPDGCGNFKASRVMVPSILESRLPPTAANPNPARFMRLVMTARGAPGHFAGTHVLLFVGLCIL